MKISPCPKCDSNNVNLNHAFRRIKCYDCGFSLKLPNWPYEELIDKWNEGFERKKNEIPKDAKVCFNCKWWEETKHKDDEGNKSGSCENLILIHERDSEAVNSDGIGGINEYNHMDWLGTGRKFGCIHFEGKEEE